jgi:hypothetical protein
MAAIVYPTAVTTNALDWIQRRLEQRHQVLKVRTLLLRFNAVAVDLGHFVLLLLPPSSQG